jgi:hypothetical protein
MGFSPIEWIGFLVLFVFTFNIGATVAEDWVQRRQAKLKGVLPTAWFTLVNLAAYALLFVGMLESESMGSFTNSDPGRHLFVLEGRWTRL